MVKPYVIIKDGVVDNLILWDKDDQPDYQPDGEAVERPVLTTLVQDESGNDVEVEWCPGIGDEYTPTHEWARGDD
jgi:hypothetical protein